jgi:hypothetical protein
MTRRGWWVVLGVNLELFHGLERKPALVLRQRLYVRHTG